MSENAPIPRIDTRESRYDQNTYSGRAKHFFIITNPLNVLKTAKELEQAKDIIDRCRRGEALKHLSDDEIWKAKYLYDSAFHPDTGEKMFLPGRMAFQVPGNMTITGCMLTFYKTTPATIFWQWMNQSFNAIVNYTNRSGDNPIANTHLALSYSLATSGAVGTALTLNSLVKRFPPVMARFVPFCAVAAANCINIPCMRSKELMEGVPVFDENGKRLGLCRRAAESAISQVVFSRIAMAVPICVLPPIVMSFLEKKAFLQRFPMMHAPVQVGLVGLVLVFATPLCCALFPQRSSLKVSHLESEVQTLLKQEYGMTTADRVYFNKGL